jgi:hypothetical protein
MAICVSYTLSIRLYMYFCCPTIVLFCPGAPKPCFFIELPVGNGNCQCFRVSSTVHHFVKNFIGKNAEAAENGHIFQLVRVFKSFVIHSRFDMQHTKDCILSLIIEALWAHQAVPIKTRVCCVGVCNFSSLHCFGGSVDLGGSLRSYMSRFITLYVHTSFYYTSP